MQFDFSKDQKALQADVRRFFERACPISVVRSLIDSDASHEASLRQQVSEQGFLAAAIPEEYGGAGAGYLELCLVAEEVGRALVPVPGVSSIYQAAELLLLGGSDAQKEKWLPRLASGASIATVALAETVGEVTPAKITASLTADLLAERISAQRIIARRGQRGLSAANLLERDQDRGAILHGGEQRQPVARRTQRFRSGADKAQFGLFAGLIDRLHRAALHPVCRQLDQNQPQAALALSCDNRQIGRHAIGYGPLDAGDFAARFQAIKHMLADMYVSLELARSNAYYGAWALATGAPQRPLAAASARVAATEAYRHCATNNIHVHGGMGFTWEFDCHLHYRRAHYLSSVLGAPPEWERKLITSYGRAA